MNKFMIYKKFMAAFIAKAQKSVNVRNIYSMAGEVLPLLNTNMGAMTLLSLGMSALSIDTQKVALFTLPGEDARAGENGASFYVMSAKSTQEALVKYFDKSDETIDKNVLFCNFEYAKFKKIYETRYELDVRFANDLQ